MTAIEQRQGSAPSVSKPEDDEISLIDLFAVLWRRRAMIIVITLIAAAGVVAFSVISIILHSILSISQKTASKRR